MASRGPFKRRALQMVVKTTTETNRKRRKTHFGPLTLVLYHEDDAGVRLIECVSVQQGLAGNAQLHLGYASDRACDAGHWGRGFLWVTHPDRKLSVAGRLEMGGGPIFKSLSLIEAGLSRAGSLFFNVTLCCFCVKQRMWDVLKHICQFDLKSKRDVWRMGCWEWFRYKRIKWDVVNQRCPLVLQQQNPRWALQLTASSTTDSWVRNKHVWVRNVRMYFLNVLLTSIEWSKALTLHVI